MRRRLLITCIIATLFVGGWGSALAAALCSHDGSHAGVADCCRRKQAPVESGHGASASHSSHEEASPSSHEDGRQDASPDCHKPEGEAAVDEGVEEEGGGESSAAAHASGGGDVALVGVGGAPVVGAGLCTHCVERPSNLPPSEAPKVNGPRIEKASQAAVGLDAVGPHTRPFTPPVTPKQGSPPAASASRRHLLLSVFLI